MKQEELVKGLKVLGLAYGKDFTQEECVTYYEFLQEYSYETFKTAIKNLIKKTKFLPKISEIIEECENSKSSSWFSIIDFMQKQGYFAVASEYDKATMWLERNVIPGWFKEDMKTYYSMMKQEKLGYSEPLRIGQVEAE